MSSFLSFPLDRPAYYVEDERLEEAELAYIDSCQKIIAQWTDANMFTPGMSNHRQVPIQTSIDSDRAELVLERLTEESQRDVEHLFKGLRSTFAQATANSPETG